MKTPDLIFLAFLATLLPSCAGDDELIYGSLDTDNNVHMTRSEVQLPPKCLSETNPRLILDWQNISTIVLNTLGNGRNPVRVTAPWSLGATTTGLPKEFCEDIKKEDGWTMLFHTFRSEGLDQNLNYMVFYNLFTGYLKVFYYSEDYQLSSSINWNLKCGNSSLIQHSLLEMIDVLTPVDGAYLDDTEDYTNGLSFNNFLLNQYFVKGWNGFQFQVSRYEIYPKLLTLSLGAESVISSQYNFDGALKTSIEGNITSYTSGLKPDAQAIANIGGEEANKWLSNLKDKHQPPDKAEDKSTSFIGKALSYAFQKVSELNFKTAIADGLKLLFGRSIIVETPNIQEVKLTQTGTITTTGQSTTISSTNFSPLRFNLYELFNPLTIAGSEVVNPEILDSGFIGLGVWTVPYTPIVYYNPVTRFVPTYVLDNGSMSEADIEGFAEYPEMTYCDYDIIFNPLIENYITEYSTTVDFVESDLFTESEFSSTKIVLSPSHTVGNHLYVKDEKQHARLVMKANLKGNKIDSSLRYFYQWPDPGNRRTVAMITVNMTINYNNQELKVSETRAYRTESMLDYGNFFPPSNGDRAVLINNINPRVISCQYQSSVPDYEP